MLAVLVLLLTLAQQPSPIQATADSVQAAAVVDSLATAEATRFDSLVTARASAVVAATDSVRAARAAARPWYERWAATIGIIALVAAVLGGAARLTLWLANVRLVASDAAIQKATVAARDAEAAAAAAQQAARDATAETGRLQSNVRSHIARADKSAKEATDALAKTRDLLDQDDRVERFRALFAESIRERTPSDGRAPNET